MLILVGGAWGLPLDYDELEPVGHRLAISAAQGHARASGDEGAVETVRGGRAFAYLLGLPPTSEEQAASVKDALTAGPADVSLLTPFWDDLRFATARPCLPALF